MVSPVLRLFAGTVLLSSSLAPVFADSATIGATRDATLYEDGAGGLANGSGQFLFVGRTLVFELRRGLIAFDLSAAVPQGSTVNSVSVELNVSRQPPPAGSSSVALHLVSGDWGEGASAPGGPEGMGTTAGAGDTTWLHTFFPSTLWVSPGGDAAVASSASVPITGVGALTLGPTAQLIADVQSWVDDPSTNFGWMLIGDEVSGVQTARRFDSREGTFSPVLYVDFDRPPAVIPALDSRGLALFALLLAGVAVTAGLRRRGVG